MIYRCTICIFFMGARCNVERHRLHDIYFVLALSAYASTDVALRGVEGQNEAMTLVMVVIGIIFAIIILFLMGIFIDCRHL